MTAPMTANEVSARLIGLSRELSNVITALEHADRDAVEKRHEADLAESRAYLEAEGSIPVREHTAKLACEREERAALLAEAVVRNLRQRVAAIKVHIDVGRTAGATVRAEIALAGAS